MKSSPHQFDIAESAKKIGQLTPRLLDKFGNPIDGIHREAIDPNWKGITLENIDTPEKLILARFHANYHRRTMHDPEMRSTINDLLQLYSKQKTLVSSQGDQKLPEGRPQNELLHRVANALGISYSTVTRYTEPEFKQKTPIKKKTSVKREPQSGYAVKETQNTLALPKCLCKGCAHLNVCPNHA